MDQPIIQRLYPPVKLALTDQLILVVNARDANKHGLAEQLAQVGNGLWSYHARADTNVESSYA